MSLNDDKIPVIKKIVSDLERIVNVKILIDEKSKNIRVIPNSGNVYDTLKVINVIKAINYGFKVEDAMKLLSDDYRLEVIDLKEFTRNQEEMRRIKGRIIGEHGRTKKIIQQYTDVVIQVGDNYIAILGSYDQVEVAKNAILMLMDGRQHSTVYKYLDRAEIDLKEKKLDSIRRNIK
ncbi:MAG: KH domain-containing protein [Sulfolobales archaeon]